MKFLHYILDGKENLGSFKNSKLYRTNFKNLDDLIEKQGLLNISLFEEVDVTKIKELPIIEYPKQDIFCLGMNYKAHKDECLKAGFDKSEEIDSVYFSKRCNKAITTNDYIDLHSDVTNEVDYEGELGIILYKDCYKLKDDNDIYDAILGYCIINDVSARDLQKKHQQFYLGKSLDTFTSISSVLVTKDEFEKKPNLNIKTFVNNELRQNDNTINMIFDVSYFMKEVTRAMTLLKGTIISTGTPSGIGKSSNRMLKKDDIVRIEINKIGILENKCR